MALTRQVRSNPGGGATDDEVDDALRVLGIYDRFAALPQGLDTEVRERGSRLSAGEKRFVSQIQGRTYANIFGLVERFINAKVLELSHDHWFGDQVALEALVRFSDEELKHQALFRRIDAMIGEMHERSMANARLLEDEE